MHKHFQWHGQLPVTQLVLQTSQVFQRQLTGQHHPLTASVSSLSNTSSTGDRHLGGAMQCQTRNELLRQTAEPQILNNQSVNACLIGSDQQLSRLGEFIAEHQDVEGEKAAYAPGVQPVHDLAEILKLKIFGSKPGIERFNTEINRIGTLGDGGLESSPITSRS